MATCPVKCGMKLLDFISYIIMDVITYPCWDLSYSILVKEANGAPHQGGVWALSATSHETKKPQDRPLKFATALKLDMQLYSKPYSEDECQISKQYTSSISQGSDNLQKLMTYGSLAFLKRNLNTENLIINCLLVEANIRYSSSSEPQIHENIHLY